jgi:hypothetical protein
MTVDAPLDAPPVSAPLNNPNAVAMFGSTLVAVADISYIGRSGIEPLAAIARVFPFAMLTPPWPA